MELFKALMVLRLSMLCVHCRGSLSAVFWLFIVYTLMNFHRVNPLIQPGPRSGHRSLPAHQNPPCAPFQSSPMAKVATLLTSNCSDQLCLIFTLNKGSHTLVLLEAQLFCSFSSFHVVGLVEFFFKVPTIYFTRKVTSKVILVKTC